MHNLTDLNYSWSKEDIAQLLIDAFEPEEGYFSKANIVRKSKNHFFPIGFLNTNHREEFKLGVLRKANTYITRCGMTDPGTWDREHVSTLHMMVMDIDCHDSELPYSAVYAATQCLYNFLLEDEIYPNVVCITGRGVQLWWFIKPLPALENLIGPYMAVVQKLIDSVQNILNVKLPAVLKRDKFKMSPEKYDGLMALKNFSVHIKATKNYSGLIRLPGSYNTWAGRFGEFSYQHKERIDILKEYFDERDPNKVKKFIPFDNTKKEKRKAAMAIYSDDLLKVRKNLYYGLVALRKKQGKTLIGVRNAMLHSLAALYMSTEHTEDEAINAAYRLNAEFDVPLPAKEVRNAISTALKKQYWYTNKKLIDILKMTDEEQTLFNFFAGRNGEAALKCQNRKDRNKKVLEMHEAGMTQVEIAEALGISQSTVCRFLNKNGIIKKTKKRKYFVKDIIARLRALAKETASKHRPIRVRKNTTLLAGNKKHRLAVKGAMLRMYVKTQKENVSDKDKGYNIIKEQKICIFNTI